MRPADVLRSQADLLGRLSNPSFIAGVDAYFADSASKQFQNVPPMAAVLRQHVQHARAYRVEESMNDELWRRANALDNYSTLPQPPSQSGYVVFDRPVAMVEIRGRIELIHVLTWGPMNIQMSFTKSHSVSNTDGVFITCWNDVSREADEVTQWMIDRTPPADFARYTAVQGPWFQSGSLVYGFDWSVGPPVVESSDSKKESIRADGDEPMDGTINMNRFYAALFGMLAETIPGATRTEEYPERVGRKQAQRAKIEPVVDVIKLRLVRPTDKGRTGTHGPIKVQYEVKSFPRTIHRGTDRERVIMVRGHTRGPEDAPWSQRSRVYDLSR